MDGNFLTNKARCGLCVYWVGRCTHPMRNDGSDYAMDCGIFFTPVYPPDTLNCKDITLKLDKIQKNEPDIKKPAYRKGEPTYESGYLRSKFGKI